MKTYYNNVNLITISSLATVGRRIDNFLLSYLKGTPKNKIYSILRKGEVRVNKKRVKCIYRLNFGDKIRIPPIQNFFLKKNSRIVISKKISKQLFNSVIYEDDYLIILNKPSGVAVHSGTGLSYGIIEGLRIIRPELNYLELVHRLDRDTSGVLLLAKNYFALVKLHSQLRLNIIKKEYLALVFGDCSFHVKIVTLPLLKNTVIARSSRIVKVDLIVGKYSKTCFVVKERFVTATLLKVNPVTGRTHQIRVHAQYIGNPIACDKIYGNKLFNKKIATSGLNRLFLHASKLEFMHPATGKIFCIEAPMDKVLLDCLLFLRN